MLLVPPMSAGADTTPAPGEPATVTADALPTWQTDGVVLAMEIVNGVAYVGGNFDHVRPPGVPRGGAGEVARTGLAAFDAATGALLPWAPVATGPIFTDDVVQTECDNLGSNQYRCDTVWEIKASPDGSRLYVAGDFGKIGTERRYRIAAFDTATGALDPDFAPSPNSRVRALAVSDTTVFAGVISPSSTTSPGPGWPPSTGRTGRCCPGRRPRTSGSWPWCCLRAGPGSSWAATSTGSTTSGSTGCRP
ncbi:hypothetical protein [Nonomuraea recticatena]|uniref:hypothetical protein n=1 Tax=Nonomuraea recticatena TaxID=46178 RepID=UPI00360E5920